MREEYLINIIEQPSVVDVAETASVIKLEWQVLLYIPSL